jgi:hypothetical protein
MSVITSETSRLKRHQLFPPHSGSILDWLPDDLLAELVEEGCSAIAERGYQVDGKWNAEVGPVAESLLDLVDLPSVVRRVASIHVTQPHAATYIGYRDENDSLDFHVDAPGFGDVNLIICLNHDKPDPLGASETVFVTPEGLVRIASSRGSFILFDGVFTPHGRTPVRRGEQVVLLSLGFKVVQPKRAIRWDHLPIPEA